MPCYLIPPALQSHFSGKLIKEVWLIIPRLIDSEESESEGEDEEAFSPEMDDTEHGRPKKQLFLESYQDGGPNNKGNILHVVIYNMIHYFFVVQGLHLFLLVENPSLTARNNLIKLRYIYNIH